MEIESIKPLLAVAVSLLGALFIVGTRTSPNVREGVSLAAAALKFLIVLDMLPAVLAGKTLHYTLFSMTPGVSIAFRVDALGISFAAVASFLWLMTTIYSIGYIRSLNEKAQTRYYLSFAITLSATMAVAFSANLLTLYVFYELAGLLSYPLVVHRETPEAFAKGNKYIFYLFMLAKFFLLAGILSYAVSGALDLKPNGIFPAVADPTLLIVIFFLFIVGISKAAIIPFHAWLPAAYTVSPTPVNAFSAANIGVFCIIRVACDVFGLDTLKELHVGLPLVYLASFTIFAASAMALTKDDLNLRLAYSTISQLSYIVLGVALLTPAGLTGAILHIMNHAFAKTTLFFCTGSIFVALKRTKVSELNGIGKRMPITMGAFTLGALSLIAFPPFGGFVSKWYLISGSVEAGQYLAIAVLITSSILNACYFLPIVHAAFFCDLPPGEKAERQEAPALMLVPLLMTALGTLIFFFAPSVFLDLANLVVGGVR